MPCCACIEFFFTPDYRILCGPKSSSPYPTRVRYPYPMVSPLCAFFICNMYIYVQSHPQLASRSQLKLGPPPPNLAYPRKSLWQVVACSYFPASPLPSVDYSHCFHMVRYKLMAWRPSPLLPVSASLSLGHQEVDQLQRNDEKMSYGALVELTCCHYSYCFDYAACSFLCRVLPWKTCYQCPTYIRRRTGKRETKRRQTHTFLLGWGPIFIILT